MSGTQPPIHALEPNPLAFMIKLKDLVVLPDRGRQTFTRIMEMSESIKKFGLIQPIVVSPSLVISNRFVLVAGERRYRGALLAGCSVIPCILRDEADDVLAEIELEENVCRADISFEEEGNLLDKIQKKKKAQNAKWTVADTAEMTNRSVGDVSSKIKIARKFKERPDLKEKCAGKPYTVAIKIIEQTEEAEKVQRLSDQGQLTLTTDLIHGDCRELIKNLESNSIDLLLTDPPYGVQKMEDLRTSGSTKMTGHQLMSDTHNLGLTEICDLLANLAPHLARVMKEGAHFYMFCAYQYVGMFIDCLEPHLEFQPPIIHWDRGRPSQPAYGYNYMSRTECIIYGCKPPRVRRLAESMYNIIECSDVPKNLRCYPTEKPIPLLQTLIKQSTQLNQLVLDPFSGSASTLIAARETGRRGIAFEVDKSAFLRAQKRLQSDESIGLFEGVTA